jgi:hypothetical protein
MSGNPNFLGSEAVGTRKGAQIMHDLIGSAGMLRGWVEVWSAHMLLLLGTLTVSVGSAGLVELLTTRQRTAWSAVDRSNPV